MANSLTITDEQLAKIIAVSIMGYVTSICGQEITNEEVKQIYEATVESINEEIPGELPFVLYFVDIYDNNLDGMRKEARELGKTFA